MMVEYICQYQEKQKSACFLEAMLIKIVAIFRVYIIISSVHIRVEHSISWALQSQHQDLISYAQHGCQHVQTVRACQICNVEIFLENVPLDCLVFSLMNEKQLSFSRNYQCEWSKKRLHFSPIVVIITSHRLKSPPPSS